MQHYLELTSELTFDSVNQLTDCFFDDSNQQIFTVRSGGATGIVVKSAKNSQIFSFCLDPAASTTIRSIKLSPDNQILALQRQENTVEFIKFASGTPNPNETITFKSKSLIFGFVFTSSQEVALFTNGGVELYLVQFEKRQLKSTKSSNLTISWFSWCPTGKFALVASGAILTPILLKPGTITKLPRLELEPGRNVLERDVTLAQLYGINSILILRQTPNRIIEVVIFSLNGPGMAPKKSHILRLGHNGRFALSILDDCICVHHQATKTSMIFDIAVPGEIDTVAGVTLHAPLTAGKAIKPFSMTVSPLETLSCEMYSGNWILFVPDIIIDAKLGCLWKVHLLMEPLCQLIGDRVKLINFLLNRSEGKSILLAVLSEMLSVEQYSGIMLPVVETIFDKLNSLYRIHLDAELAGQMATAGGGKQMQQKVPRIAGGLRVLVDQTDMFTKVFAALAETAHVGKILMLYTHSLSKHRITLQAELSKMIIADLVRRKQFNTLHNLMNYSVLSESKPLACYLLSLSKADPTVTQLALDMLRRLKANEIIIEVLLEQGKVIDALRIAKQLPGGADHLSARKYLEAAQKTMDAVIFHSVYSFFQQRNAALRGNPDFLRHEQCYEYEKHYSSLFRGETAR